PSHPPLDPTAGRPCPARGAAGPRSPEGEVLSGDASRRITGPRGPDPWSHRSETGAMTRIRPEVATPVAGTIDLPPWLEPPQCGPSPTMILVANSANASGIRGILFAGSPPPLPRLRLGDAPREFATS